MRFEIILLILFISICVSISIVIIYISNKNTEEVIISNTPNTLTPQIIVSKLITPQTIVSQTTTTDIIIPDTTVSDTTIPDTTVSETTVPDIVISRVLSDSNDAPVNEYGFFVNPVSGKCIDVDSTGILRMRDCKKTDSQMWIFDNYTIKNKSNKCMDVDKLNSFKDGHMVQSIDCNGQDQQVFTSLSDNKYQSKINFNYDFLQNKFTPTEAKCLSIDGVGNNDDMLMISLCSNNNDNQQFKFHK